MIRQLFEPHIQKASHDSVFGGRATILLTHKISHDLLPLVGLSGFPAGWNPGKKRLCAAFFRLPAVPRPKRVYSCRGLHVDPLTRHLVEHRAHATELALLLRRPGDVHHIQDCAGFGRRALGYSIVVLFCLSASCSAFSDVQHCRAR